MPERFRGELLTMGRYTNLPPFTCACQADLGRIFWERAKQRVKPEWLKHEAWNATSRDGVLGRAASSSLHYRRVMVITRSPGSKISFTLVSGTFSSRLMGQQLSDAPCDLSFDVVGRGACRWYGSCCSIRAPSLKFVDLPVRKIWHTFGDRINRLMTLTFDLLSSKYVPSCQYYLPRLFRSRVRSRHATDRQTDGRTDGQTDTQTPSFYKASSLGRPGHNK